MLSQEVLNDYYKHVRKFTVKQSGYKIAYIEKVIREVFSSHQEALKEIEKLKKSQTIKDFRLFWKTGQIQDIRGTSIVDACMKSGLGGGSISALDYYEEL